MTDRRDDLERQLIRIDFAEKVERDGDRIVVTTTFGKLSIVRAVVERIVAVAAKR